MSNFAAVTLFCWQADFICSGDHCVVRFAETSVESTGAGSFVQPALQGHEADVHQNIFVPGFIVKLMFFSTYCQYDSKSHQLIGIER